MGRILYRMGGTLKTIARASIDACKMPIQTLNFLFHDRDYRTKPVLRMKGQT